MMLVPVEATFEFAPRPYKDDVEFAFNRFRPDLCALLDKPADGTIKHKKKLDDANTESKAKRRKVSTATVKKMLDKMQKQDC